MPASEHAVGRRVGHHQGGQVAGVGFLLGAQVIGRYRPARRISPPPPACPP